MTLEDLAAMNRASGKQPALGAYLLRHDFFWSINIYEDYLPDP